MKLDILGNDGSRTKVIAKAVLLTNAFMVLTKQTGEEIIRLNQVVTVDFSD